MSLTETLEKRHHEVEDTRDQVQRVTDSLLQADRVLEKTDDVLIGAEEIVEQSKRLAPAIGIGIAVTAAVVLTIVVIRRRRARRP